MSSTTNQIRDGELNILVGHTAFLSPGDFAVIKTARTPYIVFQAEALDSSAGFAPRYPNYIDFLPSAAQVWDYSLTNLTFLAARGCTDVQYIPIGYSRRLERIARAPFRDIDVLFYGVMTPRRRLVLDELIGRDVRVQYLFRAYGPERDQAIARAKLILNLHQFGTGQLEQIRIAYLLNNRCLVVSEAADCNPYGEGVVFRPFEELAGCCQFFLQHGMEAECERIAQAGHASVMAIPMVESMRAALQRFGAGGAVAN